MSPDCPDCGTALAYDRQAPRPEGTTLVYRCPACGTERAYDDDGEATSTFEW